MKMLMFEAKAFDEYQEWIKMDRKISLKIGALIKETLKDPFTGLGKPEPLKGNLKGYWSRRITDEHRLIYKVTDAVIIVASCYTHYNK